MRTKRGDMKRCPRCHEWVPRDASQCSYCHFRPWLWNEETRLLLGVIIIGLIVCLVVYFQRFFTTS